MTRKQETENIEPEFVRVPQIYQRTGLKRGLIYRRINDGTFKSMELKEPGNQQGIRLVLWSSVKEYLYRVFEEQQGGK